MNTIVRAIEESFAAIPLPLLEVWGRLGYWLGFGLMLLAFGRFTLRPGGRWGLGRERQAWNTKAFSSIPLTFVLIILTGWLGSFFVLVPGAQTFESLKDLVVFVCIVLFGYPALITVPFAYGLSDLIEGVPPSFLIDWLPGYFINAACFWVAYHFIGRNPDFRRVRTWGAYLGFVLLFLAIEPVLWGHLSAAQFTPEISYRTVTPALIFTTGVTWLLAPLVMLAALPLARRLGFFWADIAGHVKQRPLRQQQWIWESGREQQDAAPGVGESGVPLRMVILAPFIVLVLLMVGATAYVTLRSAAQDANRLAEWLHQEITGNINLRLDEQLSRPGAVGDTSAIADLLRELPVAAHGRAFIVDRDGRLVASSAPGVDAVVATAIGHLVEDSSGGLQQLPPDHQFRFVRIDPKPLSRETWFARATAYQDRSGGHNDWIMVTAMPESYYLSGIQTGNSRSAVIFALALLLSLAVAAVLASKVTAPIRRISRATQALAAGDLAQQLPGSPLEEMDMLARSFNDMAERLKRNFDALSTEVEMRKQAEKTLQQAQIQLLAFTAELEQRVAQRTWELQALNHELETFCYSVSHDLRAPLRGIAGFTEVLAKNYAGALDDKAQGYLGRVLAATNRMGELIDDLLKLSRVSRDQMQREMVDLSAIANEVLANLQNAAPEREAELFVEDGLAAEGDPRLLRILLENLLDNAWKFTSKTPVARIAFTADSEDGAPLFTVRDNGAGFDMRYADKLFGPFQRLHRMTEFPGTGVGLATVQRIVNRHGGRIRAEAELGKGATFRFSL
ncbi:ATP-binding protein [Thauera sp. Sel9]|uniref:ATP-binding protein n=1 Tax=Thauera sp. Sel9 TaxID=2974299 RepID=UPI0021E16BDA|nr:ATP-binding protein [Thauera sp. Sel9]MCV2218488.1 ATP-binding protein [Thauera sp. Sel9]